MLPEDIFIKSLQVSAYTIPTDLPESDGTLQWDNTTLVLVTLTAADKTGIGYTYANAATAYYIDHSLRDIVLKCNALDIAGCWQQMIQHIRNNGNAGITYMAVSAVDNALWDLKAKLLGLPLCSLIGQVHESMPIYGSGGFTSYSNKQLQDQLAGWAEQGIKKVKMKIGREPEKDPGRVKAAREAIDKDVELMVDANGAYRIKQAVQLANIFQQYGVNWLEEPVSSDDLQGLNFIRNHVPAPVQIAAGEYGYQADYFQKMLAAQAVDILQADATRCGGITGFLKLAAICEAHHIPLSSHCAPALHLHAAVGIANFYAAEYFHDHVHIDQLLFDGIPAPVNGVLYPDKSRPGNGFECKETDAAKYKVYG